MKPFEESDRYLYNLSPDSLVIDAGAHKGDFTAEIVRRYDCQVIALEPVKRFYKIVSERFKDSPKVTVLNSGIGYGTGLARMFVKGDMTGEFAQGQEWERVYLRGIIEFLDTYCQFGRTIKLLKLNIEGGEFDVLERLLDCQPVSRLYLTKNIQVQFHSVVPDAEARYQQIHTALLKTHHLTFDAGPWVWQNYRLNE